MNISKRMAAGAAAFITACAGAQAADLPMAEPVEYVRVCNTYGEGFFYIPGSKTCLQISGYVRATRRFEEPFQRDDSLVYYRVRARVNFDTRTETEYGTLRTYIRLQSDHSSRNSRSANSDPFRSNSSPTGTSSLDSGFYAEKAFIQFAGITAGLTTSFFDFYASANFIDGFAGSDQTVQAIGYTATLGNGFTATIAAEDRAYREFGSTGPYSGFPSTAVPGGIITFAGQEMPDVLGVLRVDQAWGSFQLAGAVHQLRGLESGRIDGAGDFVGRGVPDTEHGFAVQAGVMFNLPMIAQGDTLYLQGAYSDGAMSYLGPIDLFGLAFDARYRRNGELATYKGYTVVGEFLHYWTPNIRSAFGASYTEIDRPLNFKSYNDIVAGATLLWSPVKDLDLGGEVYYQVSDFQERGKRHIDQFRGLVVVERRF